RNFFTLLESRGFGPGKPIPVATFRQLLQDASLAASIPEADKVTAELIEHNMASVAQGDHNYNPETGKESPDHYEDEGGFWWKAVTIKANPKWAGEAPAQTSQPKPQRAYHKPQRDPTGRPIVYFLWHGAVCQGALLKERSDIPLKPLAPR